MITHTDFSEYAALIFDCDGVIFDSNAAKTTAFRDTALRFGYSEASASEFAEWQSQNFGTSRYAVVEALIGGRFGPPVGVEPDRAQLLSHYARLVRMMYSEVPTTAGLTSFLDSTRDILAFVASGSDQEELRDVLNERNIASRFAGIFGSPTSKKEIVIHLVEGLRSTDPAARILMIGDAHTDLDAAMANDIDFLFLAGYSSVRRSMLERVQALGLPHLERFSDIEASVGVGGEASDACGVKGD